METIETTRHTPGSWSVGSFNSECKGKAAGYGVWAKSRLVAGAFAGNCDDGEDLANARLIAAAPALLAAAEDLLGTEGDILPLVTNKGLTQSCFGCGRDYTGYDDLGSGDLCPADDCPRHRMRAAIAAAKGQ